MSSYRIVIRQRVSDIHNSIFPAIHLHPEKQHEIGLISFDVFNRIPTITSLNNKLYFSTYLFDEGILAVELKPGIFSLDEIIININSLISTDSLRFKYDNTEKKYKIYTTGIQLYAFPDSILTVFGFPSYPYGTLYPATTIIPPESNTDHHSTVTRRDTSQINYETTTSPPPSSDNPFTDIFLTSSSTSDIENRDSGNNILATARNGVKIIKFTNIKFATKTSSPTHAVYLAAASPSLSNSTEVYITCPLVTNSYKNHQQSRILHSFSIPSEAYYTHFIERPNNVVYLPLISHANIIRELVLRIEDEHSRLIDFDQEYIRIVLHIREVVSTV
jgi:hypothetical protein